jgi:hypothetical protein
VPCDDSVAYDKEGPDKSGPNTSNSLMVTSEIEANAINALRPDTFMCARRYRSVHERIGKLFVFSGISRSKLVTMPCKMSIAFPQVGKRHGDRFLSYL